MNLSTFVELASELVDGDERRSISNFLGELLENSSNLASNPTEVNFQQALLTTIEGLKAAVLKMMAEYTPGAIQNIPEIGAERWFTMKFVEDIEKTLQMAQITPGIMRDRIHSIVNERMTYIGNLKSADESLRSFGILEDEIDVGEAIGKFVIPRPIFDNDLSKLEKEIKFVVRLLDTVNEISTGSVQPLTLQTMSTSDPTIVVALNLLTGKTLAGLMAWALGTWGIVEANRKFRAETNNFNADTALKMKQLIDKDTDDKIRQAIENKALELVGVKPQGRKAELKTAIEKLLKQLLERVERGFSIIIKAIKHAKPDNEEQKEENKTVGEINALSQNVEPLRSLEHLMALTYDPDDKDA